MMEPGTGLDMPSWLVNCTDGEHTGGSVPDYNLTTDDEDMVFVDHVKTHGVTHRWTLGHVNTTTYGDSVAVNTSINVTEPPYIFDVSLEFMFFSLSVVIPMGLVCNTISIMVFMSQKLRNRAASWYLAALAASDDISLIAIMFDYWLKADRIGISVIKTSNALCLTITHMSYASRLFSAWLVTSFTVERFVGVVFPLKRASLSTTSHARKVIAFELVVCIVSTSFILFTIGIVNERYGIECDIIPERKRIYLVFNVIFLIFGSIVIPILTIVTLNMFILQKIFKRKNRFVPKNTTFAASSNGTSATRVAAMQSTTSYKTKRGYNIATIFLVVSSVFVVLNIPYCVCWFLLFFRYQGSSGVGAVNWSLFAAKYITSVPYYLNYAINFALYSLCARAFRVELWRLLKCYPCKRLSRNGCMDTRPTSVQHESKQKGTPRRLTGSDSDRPSKEMCEKILSLPLPQNEQEFTQLMRPDTL